MEIQLLEVCYPKLPLIRAVGFALLGVALFALPAATWGARSWWLRWLSVLSAAVALL